LSKLRKLLIDQGYTIDPVSEKERFGYFEALEYAKELMGILPESRSKQIHL